MNLLNIGKILLIILSASIAINLVLEKKSPAQEVKFGVTFSSQYTKYLKLDWQKTYAQVLDDLQVKNLRLLTYWDVLQVSPGKYDFKDSDYLLNEASKRGAKVVLVLGMRQPRWPECHIPKWAKMMTVSDRQQKILQLIKIVVEKYKNNNAIWAWQVENEPFVSWFGENCDPPDEKFLQEEIKLVKNLDSSRPVIVTDSGEWSSWIPAMKSADILGISVYRKAHNQFLNSYISYPFPAWMYPLKSDLARKLFAPHSYKTIVSELQTEPWLQKAVLETPIEEQVALFSVRDLQANIAYAKRTGMSEQYLWGVEWWYFMAQNGYPQYLNFAKTLFK